MKPAKLASGLVAAILVALAVSLASGLFGSDDILLGDTRAERIEGADGALRVFLTIENTGAADLLIGAEAAGADGVSFSVPADNGLAVPAKTNASLAADGAHLKLTGVKGDLSVGRTIPVTLVFARAGKVTTRARVSQTRATGHAGHPGMTGNADIHVVAGDAAAPQISLAVRADGDGWLVQAIVRDFEFARDLADGPHVPGKGHGHLYLNGLKLQRLYEPTARIHTLPPGRHEVRVTLNTNDHRMYVAGGDPVTASAMIEVR